MNASLLEGIRSTLGVWPLWLVLGVFAVIAWKMPRRKGGRAGVDQSTTLHNGMAAPFSDRSLSDTSLHPYSISNEFRNKY